MQSFSGAEIPRREFIFQSAAAATAGMFAAAARCEEAPKAYPAGTYVDVHTHLGQTWNTTEPLSAKALLSWMDKNDISQAVVLPLVSPESSSFLLTSDFVLAETKPHRDRLVPFCCVDPRTSYSGGKPALVEILKRYAGEGAKGFGEHKAGVLMDDPRNLLLYEACGELKLPVLYHSDTQRNIDAPGLPALESVLKKFPQTTFIAHATAWWSSISADVKDADQLGAYPKEKVVPGGAIERLMTDYPNIYGDLSAGSGANAIQRDLKFGREFLIRWADRLLFGTDFLAPGQAVPQLTLFQQLELPADVQAKVFRDNVRRILRLNPA